MEDLRTLVTGVAGGLIVLVIAGGFRAYRRKSISEDIKFLEYEKSHLEAMKRSSVEMNRSSFRTVFFLLFLLGLANLMPKLFSYLPAGAMSSLGSLLTLFIWVFVCWLMLQAVAEI